MLSLYRTISSKISQQIGEKGQLAVKTPAIRTMRSIKKESLKLVDTFVSKLTAPEAFTDEYATVLFEAILSDYRSNIKEAREAEVLNVTAAIVSCMKTRVNSVVLPIFNSVFDCTLDMINKDFTDYPDHRISFFKLLQALTTYCFEALLQLPADQFKLFIDSVIWAFKHSHRDVSDIGLRVCSSILSKINECSSALVNSFYTSYFTAILQDVFFVLTDSDHKAGRASCGYL